MHVLQQAAGILADPSSWRVFLDILLCTVIIYYVVMLIKGTRAVQLAWGLAVLFIAAELARQVQFKTLGTLLSVVKSPGATVFIVILFYPELRHALEEVGRGRLWPIRGLLLRREDIGAIVDDLVDTAVQLSQQRIGALVVLARNDGLDDVTGTGTMIDAAVSPRLLMSIFYPGTPLHDGAVVIRGSRIAAAECVLPLSENPRISASLHTRHRAALGLAEKTDAAVLVVSEETGNISLAYDGRLLTALRPEVVRDKLLSLFQQEESQGGTRGDGKRRSRLKRETPMEDGRREAATPRHPAGVAAARVLATPGYRLWAAARSVAVAGSRLAGRRARIRRGEAAD